jgi:hypothetical protein
LTLPEDTEYDKGSQKEYKNMIHIKPQYVQMYIWVCGKPMCGSDFHNPFKNAPRACLAAKRKGLLRRNKTLDAGLKKIS